MASRGAAQDILSLIQHDQTPTAADERAHEASCRERQFLDAENRAQIPPRLRPSGEARAHLSAENRRLSHATYFNPLAVGAPISNG
jgi:hypothetical protein